MPISRAASAAGLQVSITQQHLLSFQLTREQRLRRRKDFVRVQTDGVRTTTKHFVFLVASQSSDAPARLGITVTRKVGCAVVRNRAKRLVRETFRQLPGLLPRGVDMVVIVRKALHGLQASDVKSEWLDVESLLRRRAFSVQSQNRRMV